MGSGGLNYVYDFENHLIQQGGATMVYDGDGNRVSKTVAGVTTTYLVSEVNPTGYVQVLSERFSGGSGAQEVLHNYVYGLDRISQYRSYFTGSQSLTQISYYVYDGHGSTRALTDPTGNVTDTYDYDAFGNLTHSATTLSSPTPNEFLFAGEQYDSNLHLYYNRARYLNTSTGRFWTTDTYEGDPQSPLSLHKYLYAGADPIDNLDPSGNQIDDLLTSFAVSATINAMSTLILNSPLGNSVSSFVASLFIPPDALQALQTLTPDAIDLSISGQVNLNTGIPVGLTGYGGFSFLASPKTGKTALYSYYGAGLSFFSTASSGGIGASIGLVFNCPTSGNYTENFLNVTLPLGALSSQIRTKIEGELLQVNVASLEAGIFTYANLFAALISDISVTELSTNKTVTVEVSPTSPHVVEVAFGVGVTASLGPSTSNWSLSDSWYSQLVPGQPVPFE